MKNDQIFDNTKIAFSLKSNAELKRAIFLFKMIAIEPLVKIGTALTNFALKLNLPIEGIIRKTIFDQFCGGVSEQDCLPVVNNMYSKGVFSVLDYSVEGKTDVTEFDKSCQIIRDIVSFSTAHEAIPIVVFKPTAFGRFDLFAKISSKKALSEAEKAEWERVVNRFDAVCKDASDSNVGVLIDAEESWMQDAADELVTDLMKTYNKDKVVVFNTLQMYRHDRMAFLLAQHKLAIKEGFKLGYKLVRGAYMEKENDRAQRLNYPTPICSDKAATDINFNTAAKYILDNINDISVFVGTHNEKSNYLVLSLMKAKNIANSDPRIWFGQLYGMGDHISFNLSEQGYNVAKYLPFGPVKDVVPYLIRRAQENTSVAGQMGRELNLLSKERKRRKTIN